MMGVDWHLKIRAFLRCPPDKVFISDERKRAEELLKLTLDNGSIPKEVEIAHKNAYALDRPPFLKGYSVNFLKHPVLTHPLSGGEEWKIKIGNWNPKAVEGALEELKCKYGDDPQKLFLAVWRLLPDKIKEKEGNIGGGIGAFWDLIPADQRVPDHSVWDHASVASALVSTVSGCAPKAVFLMFTVASVEVFLSHARRTQDLWMGSFLLSFFIWEAIKVIAEKYGPDCIISPDLREQPLVDLWLQEERCVCDVPKPKIDDLSIANLPNIFTALLPRDEVEEIAKEAEGRMKEKWREIAEKVKRAVESAAGNLAGDNIWKGIWKRQIEEDNLLDRLGVFWVIYPWEEIDKALQRYEGLFPPPEGGRERAEVECVKRLLKRIKDKDKVPGMAYPIFSSLTSWNLTARKNLRDFSQVEEPGHKCSLCGVREALYRSGKRVAEFWDELMKVEGWAEGDKVKLRGRIRKGDRLCAVCLTKRLAWEHYFIPYFKEKKVPGADRWVAHVLFPSTASMATAKFKEEIIRQIKGGKGGELRKALKLYVERMEGLLRKEKKYDIFLPSAPIPKLERSAEGDELLKRFLRIDGEWLFEESFNKEAIEREYGLVKGSICEGDLRLAREALSGLLNRSEELKIRKPGRYYALIAIDGDKMGDWISGKRGPKFSDLIHPSVHKKLNSQQLKILQECEPRPLGPSLHKGISGALRNFSLYAVKHIVEEEHTGKLIYAGGDGVLAFLPLEELLPVMRELRWLFSGEREGGGFELKHSGFLSFKERLFMMMGEKGPTISAGAVIAHYTHPFSHVVEEAYEALEKEAKETQGRDAFAFHLLKRSGEPVKVGAKWSYGDLDLLEILGKIAGWFQEEKLSPRLVYQMKEESPGLSVEHPRSKGWEQRCELSKARLCELKRLVSRHIKAEDKRVIGGELEKLLRKVEGGIENRINQIKGELGSEEELKELEEQLWRLWDKITDLLFVVRFIAKEM